MGGWLRRRDGGRLCGEGLRIVALLLGDREQRVETETEDRQLGRPGRGGELDRLDELSLRPCGVVGEQQGGGSSEHGRRPPGVARGKGRAGGVGVVEHLVGAVTTAEPSQNAEARVIAAEPAHRSV